MITGPLATPSRGASRVPTRVEPTALVTAMTCIDRRLRPRYIPVVAGMMMSDPMSNTPR